MKQSVKQLKCEMCDSTNLIKQDGMFVCQDCGAKYTVDEVKKMMAEASAGVPAEVPAPANNDAPTSLIRARQSLAHGEMTAAKEYFDRVLDADPQNAEAWWGKFLVDFNVTDENAFFKKPDLYLFRQIENNSNYREALQYAKEPFLARINRFQAEMENHSEIARENEEKECFKIEPDTSYKGDPLCLKEVTLEAWTRYSKLVIPEGVKIIGEKAFKWYTFKRVTFPKSLWLIEGELSTAYDWVNNEKIKHEEYGIDEVCFPDLATFCKTHRKDDKTFDEKTRILIDGKELPEELEIPVDVTYIGKRAFFGFKKLKKVSIPNSVTEIGRGAFHGCASLTDINIPNSVTEIGWGAFENCESLTDINIPNGVTEIGWGTFIRCSSLTNITIPNSVTKLGTRMIDGCSSLTNITIPNSVTEIEPQAFIGSGLTEMTIPGSVKTIAFNLFSGCRELTDVTICEGVETIEEGAFWGCEKLRRIIIPKSVKSIAMYEQVYDYGTLRFKRPPFDGCNNLKDVTIPKKLAGPFRSKLKKIFQGASKKIEFHLI